MSTTRRSTDTTPEEQVTPGTERDAARALSEAHNTLRAWTEDIVVAGLTRNQALLRHPEKLRLGCSEAFIGGSPILGGLRSPQEALERAARYLESLGRAAEAEHIRAEVRALGDVALRLDYDWEGLDAPKAIEETIDPLLRYLKSAEQMLTEAATTAVAPNRPRTQPSELVLDEDARQAFWAGEPVGINAHMDFDVLLALYRRAGKVVSYLDLHKVATPETDAKTVNTVKEVPDVEDAVKHIRRALSKVGCPYKITSVRKIGYRLDLVAK